MSNIKLIDSHSHYATALLGAIGKMIATGGASITTGGVNNNSRIAFSNGYAAFAVPSPSAYFALGGYWKPLIASKVMEVAENAAAAGGHVALGVNVTTGVLTLYRTAATTAPTDYNEPAVPNYVPLVSSAASTVTASIWYGLEVIGYLHDTNGWVHVYVNGNLVIDFHGDTRNGGVPNANLLYIHGDSTGATWSGVWVGSDAEGELRVDPQFPTANGTARDWARSAGADDYSLVNETAADTTTYLSTSTVGARTSLVKEVLRHSSGQVKAIQVTAYAIKMDAGPCGFKTYLLMGGTRYYSSEFFPSLASWQGFPYCWPLQPVNGTPAWTQTDANNAEVGIERTT